MPPSIHGVQPISAFTQRATFALNKAQFVLPARGDTVWRTRLQRQQLSPGSPLPCTPCTGRGRGGSPTCTVIAKPLKKWNSKAPPIFVPSQNQGREDLHVNPAFATLMGNAPSGQGKSLGRAMYIEQEQSNSNSKMSGRPASVGSKCFSTLQDLGCRVPLSRFYHPQYRVWVGSSLGSQRNKTYTTGL